MTLVLVVGPSGAGKDSVMNYARARRSDVVFARRVITRPVDGTEAHEAVSAAEFAARDFILSWRAHGLSYGIPAEYLDDLRRGACVVANVSRGVVGRARGLFPCVVVEITAPEDVLARRLSARGRESAEDVANRLARSVEAARADAVIVNDGALEKAGAAFLEVLDGAS